MGYLKSGSQKSLLAGGISASLLYYVHTQLPTNPVFASSLGLGKRFLDSQPILYAFPVDVSKRSRDFVAFRGEGPQPMVFHFAIISFKLNFNPRNKMRWFNKQVLYGYGVGEHQDP